MIILAITWGIAKDYPSVKFQEYGFITKLSSIQLLICGFIGAFLYNKHKKIIWLLISIGFIFLSMDEVLQIHENTDTLIHHTFNIKETALSDRIDDFIILIYGIIGAVVMYKNKNIFLSNKRGVIILSAGFSFMVISVVIDIVSNSENDTVNVLNLLFQTIPPETIYQIASIAEESIKIIAEAFLLSGFFSYIHFLKNDSNKTT